ncbi:MAG: hypothetical protein OEU26_24275 [Candidatus Tectomicrobia bacterium]|nr:hypothetical protein [Candidatus Tectomicrobia bacterium]
MRAYKVETTIPENGVLELDALPFQAGEAVEVIICLVKSPNLQPSWLITRQGVAL